MSDTRSIGPPPRSPRIGLIAVLVAIALVVGIGLMVYAVRTSGGWFSRTPAPATPPAASTYMPAQPVPAAGMPPAAVVAIDPVMLANRETTLAAQLSALEARTANVAVEASGASGKAARAEAMLIALAARRAIDRGAPLGYLEEQLRVRFGPTQPKATLTLLQSVRQPVTIEGLRAGLEGRAGVLVTGGGDWITSLWRQLTMLVIVRDGASPSPLPTERIARARRLLDLGQVEMAMAEVRRLPGARRVDPWMAVAQRWVDTHAALDTIEAAAVLGQASATPAPIVQPMPPGLPAPVTR